MGTPQLRPLLVSLNNPLFGNICTWPFADAYVSRLLRDDIPQRIKYGHGRVIAFQEPTQGTIVGFGTIDICDDYKALAEHLPHPYIPLLAVHPAHEGNGYGKAIVNQLVAYATVAAARQQPIPCHPVLFLDVYEDNAAARHLYEKHGQFTYAHPHPVLDTAEGKTFMVMSRPL